MGPSAKRERRVAEGLDLLASWLLDLAHDGWGRHDLSELETLSRRLVDAQLPGLARSVRALRDDAHDPLEVARRIGELHLLVRSYRTLGPDDVLRPDLERKLGFIRRKATVLAEGARVRDRWYVLGSVETEPDDEGITARRTWLLGLGTGTYGLILEYAAPMADLPTGLEAGSSADGELAFYPSATPLRAVFDGELDRFEPHENAPLIRWGRTLEAVWEERRARLLTNPWSGARACGLCDMRVIETDRIHLVAPSGLALGLDGEDGAWCLASAAGAPGLVFGELWGPSFIPMLMVGPEGWVAR